MNTNDNKAPRYKVEESRTRPGTYNVVDMKRVVAIAMGKSEVEAERIAQQYNKGA